MDANRFWELIGKARTKNEGSDDSGFIEALDEVLQTLPPDELIAFQKELLTQDLRGYNWKLWGAAYIINGGASDDGFDYWRCWLISQGQERFEAALADPDSLAEWAEEDAELEELMYAAHEVYEEKADDDIYSHLAPIERPELDDGWDFDDEDEMRKRYPKLCARMWDA